MQREYYLNLAAEGLRMPIGADLILHEKSDPQACRLNGEWLGEILVETARKFRTPLAFPLMDLRIEKEWLLREFGIAQERIDTYHFQDGLTQADVEKVRNMLNSEPTSAMKASLTAISHVAHTDNLVPVGMCIGPFSLMTKLIDDPITAVFLASLDATEKEAVSVFSALELGTLLICKWIELQIAAGAKAICVCEPAYNTVYISPNQFKANPQLLDDLVIRYNNRMRDVMRKHDVDLIFHDCGALTEEIIASCNKLDPAILSLGSPSDMTLAAKFTQPQTVLFGNLPSKKFYSDNEMTQEQVRQQSRLLIKQMATAGHPFILATECDVLSVPGCEQTIMKKVMAMLDA
ncbi:MAG TPA: uroporphyrinogen decarboxylase family protein [Phycisphaerae bacterium]|nr:uroporphyrinogen decarboxylase family protein [Phycisphaerae bacterium]